MAHKTHFTYHQALAALLIFFSFFMTALISRTVFERLPHLEDEVAYLYQARIFARGDMVIESPVPRNAYWQPFVVDYRDTGSRFGKYSPGWPALLALGVSMGQEWVINAFFAALTVAVVYRLGTEIFNKETGLAAAALTAFSPMALLLNASMMSHTSALSVFTLFMYTYWRIEKGKKASQWAVLAGISLGLLVVNRPLTAIGVIAPFILWSALKVLHTLYRDFQLPGRFRDADSQFIPTLRPFVILGVIAILISVFIPFFNNAATGDPSKNLYTLVWDYDQVGFGKCCGRSSDTAEGHTILKGVRHARFDLSLTAADLFGWQLEPITPELQDYLTNSAPVFWLALGLSFFIIPFGLVMGFKEWWAKGWIIIGMLWLVVPLARDMPFLKEDQALIWQWLLIGGAWLLIPPVSYAFQKDSLRSRWTWLLLCVIVGLIGVHLAYWIGSQRYSTRYYFESLTAFALIAAIPIGWLAQHIRREIFYVVFTGVLMWSLYNYSTPRIHALYQFNHVTDDFIESVKARRTDDRPILVIATDVQNSNIGWTWRSFGSLMTVTNPYLDSEIVVARDSSGDGVVREQILEKFPNRQVIDLLAQGENAWFADDCAPVIVVGTPPCPPGYPITSTSGG